MIYLTYNDAPGGVYNSQVIDTCRFWQETFGEEVKLVALISGRGFLATRKKIKQAYKNSLVLPMYPGIINWEKNARILKLFISVSKKQNVIARGVFAALLARGSRRFAKVCFDGRGAYAAEWMEYMKNDSPDLAKDMNKLESEAVMNSDSCMAVSQKLVDYWKSSFLYSSSRFAIVPCTLSNTIKTTFNATDIKATRNKLGAADNEILLVYAGSSAGWQSFTMLNDTLTKALTENSNIKLLMLSKPGEEKALAAKFPNRVMQQWVAENEVHTYLQAADYGLLIREDSVTNQVSSPVKFAEYLAAGLPVIISEHIGDFSGFVQEHNCGMLIDSVNWTGLTKPDEATKRKTQGIAEQYFRKKNYIEEYRKLF